MAEEETPHNGQTDDCRYEVTRTSTSCFADGSHLQALRERKQWSCWHPLPPLLKNAEESVAGFSEIPNDSPKSGMSQWRSFCIRLCGSVRTESAVAALIILTFLFCP